MIPTASLLTSAGFSIVAAAVYLYVAFRINRRQLGGADRVAQSMFVAWWVALGLSSLIVAAQLALYAQGALALPVYKVMAQVNLLAIMAGLFGLLYYLIYLYTGSSRIWLPLAAFYVAMWLYFAYRVELADVQAIHDTGWALETEPTPEWSQTGIFLILAAVLGPQMAASVALFRLYFKVDERTQKYRIALVSWSILIWFGMAVMASLSGFSEAVWWQWVSRAISLAAALAILAAYVPPAWARKRYNLESIS